MAMTPCFDYFVFPPSLCCDSAHGPSGFPGCWDEEYTFERCCGSVTGPVCSAALCEDVWSFLEPRSSFSFRELWRSEAFWAIRLVRNQSLNCTMAYLASRVLGFSKFSWEEQFQILLSPVEALWSSYVNVRSIVEALQDLLSRLPLWTAVTSQPWSTFLFGRLYGHRNKLWNGFLSDGLPLLDGDLPESDGFDTPRDHALWQRIQHALNRRLSLPEQEILEYLSRTTGEPGPHHRPVAPYGRVCAMLALGLHEALKAKIGQDTRETARNFVDQASDYLSKWNGRWRFGDIFFTKWPILQLLHLLTVQLQSPGVASWRGYLHRTEANAVLSTEVHVLVCGHFQWSTGNALGWTVTQVSPLRHGSCARGYKAVVQSDAAQHRWTVLVTLAERDWDIKERLLSFQDVLHVLETVPDAIVAGLPVLVDSNKWHWPVHRVIESGKRVKYEPYPTGYAGSAAYCARGDTTSGSRVYGSERLLELLDGAVADDDSSFTVELDILTKRRFPNGALTCMMPPLHEGNYVNTATLSRNAAARLGIEEVTLIPGRSVVYCANWRRESYRSQQPLIVTSPCESADFVEILLALGAASSNHRPSTSRSSEVVQALPVVRPMLRSNDQLPTLSSKLLAQVWARAPVGTPSGPLSSSACRAAVSLASAADRRKRWSRHSARVRGRPKCHGGGVICGSRGTACTVVRAWSRSGRFRQFAPLVRVTQGGVSFWVSEVAPSTFPPPQNFAQFVLLSCGPKVPFLVPDAYAQQFRLIHAEEAGLGCAASWRRSVANIPLDSWIALISPLTWGVLPGLLWSITMVAREVQSRDAIAGGFPITSKGRDWHWPSSRLRLGYWRLGYNGNEFIDRSVWRMPSAMRAGGKLQCEASDATSGTRLYSPGTLRMIMGSTKSRDVATILVELDIATHLQHGSGRVLTCSATAVLEENYRDYADLGDSLAGRLGVEAAWISPKNTAMHCPTSGASAWEKSPTPFDFAHEYSVSRIATSLCYRRSLERDFCKIVSWWTGLDPQTNFASAKQGTLLTALVRGGAVSMMPWDVDLELGLYSTGPNVVLGLCSWHSRWDRRSNCIANRIRDELAASLVLQGPIRVLPGILPDLLYQDRLVFSKLKLEIGGVFDVSFEGWVQKMPMVADLFGECTVRVNWWLWERQFFEVYKGSWEKKVGAPGNIVEDIEKCSSNHSACIPYCSPFRNFSGNEEAEPCVLEFEDFFAHTRDPNGSDYPSFV